MSHKRHYVNKAFYPITALHYPKANDRSRIKRTKCLSYNFCGMRNWRRSATTCSSVNASSLFFFRKPCHCIRFCASVAPVFVNFCRHFEKLRTAMPPNRQAWAGLRICLKTYVNRRRVRWIMVMVLKVSDDWGLPTAHHRIHDYSCYHECDFLRASR